MHLFFPCGKGKEEEGMSKESQVNRYHAGLPFITTRSELVKVRQTSPYRSDTVFRPCKEKSAKQGRGLFLFALLCGLSAGVLSVKGTKLSH